VLDGRDFGGYPESFRWSGLRPVQGPGRSPGGVVPPQTFLKETLDMQRKWTVVGATAVSISMAVVGFAMAQDEHGPLHEVMEQVNKNNVNITKGVRSAVAYKKAQKDVVTSAEELVKLSKKAREVKVYAEKQKQPHTKWTALVDDLTKTAEELASVAGKSGTTNLQAKKAHAKVKAACTACHTVFRIDDSETNK
jgi:hypothetical protein